MRVEGDKAVIKQPLVFSLGKLHIVTCNICKYFAKL